MANLIKTLAVGTTDYEFNAAQVSDTSRQHKLEVTTDGKVTIDNNQLALKSEITTAVENMQSYQHTITANATDGIFDVKGTSGANAVTYAVDPYTTAQAGKFYTGTTAPSGTDRLNYGGNLYATKLYSGGAEVLTSETKNTAGSTDTSSKIFLVGATSQGANPQTYSHDTAYVGTDGCLYSGSKKVIATGDTATAAAKLADSTDAGTSTKPVYFDNGVPVEANLLEGITGNYATKTVGNINGTTASPVQITATTLPDLLKQVLGISEGVAPSSFNISADAVNVDMSSSAVTKTITPKWSISKGTFNGTFTFTAEGTTSATQTSTAASGTFSSTINISVANNVDTVTISGSAAGTGFTTLTDTTAITIKRPVSWGAGALGTPTYYAKSSLTSGIQKSFTTSNNKVMFKYPKYWGTLKNIDIPGVGNAIESFNRTTSSDGLYYIYEDKNASTATVTCTFKL